MRSPAAVVALVVVGLVLMANPMYLPIAIGEPTPAYTHVVQPAGPDTPTDEGSDVVDRDALDGDAGAAFDRALDADEGGFVVEDPDDRAGSLAYPTEPSPGHGLIVVAHEGTEYEFWTRTVEREPGIVVAQRVVVQPVAFLVGFLAVIGAVAVGFRERL